jgi:hypothetical protein
MPNAKRSHKDKPEFQPLNPNDINQIWMIEEVLPNRYEIVHARSTLVLSTVLGSSKCKLEFGRMKKSQLFCL